MLSAQLGAKYCVTISLPDWNVSLLLLLGLLSRSLPVLGSGDFDRLLRRSPEWPWSRLRLRLRSSPIRWDIKHHTIGIWTGWLILISILPSLFQIVATRKIKEKLDCDVPRFGPRVILFDHESFSRETS